jgi:hypothetical protein
VLRLTMGFPFAVPIGDSMMSRKKKNGPTALATIESAPPARQITRSHANALLKERALELYHEARTQREEQIRAFESEYGRVDRIDHTVLADLQRIQARLAAISARQQRSSSTNGEPKVSKHVEMLGQLIGSVAGYLATERALELFAPIHQSDYIGWNNGGVGAKGHDESVLAASRSSTIRLGRRTSRRPSTTMARCACIRR